MKRIMTFGSLALLALNLSLAQENVAPPNQMGDNGARVLRQLKLTDQQRKDIDQIRFELQKQTIDQQAKLKTERLELAQLFKADNPDQSAIQKKVGAISQLQSQQRLMIVDHWFAVNKLLTPDQQKIWKRVSARLWMQHRARAMRSRAAGFMGRPGMRQRMSPAPGAMGR
jgi:Spy/CpxP family protein refolding chaperone